MLTSAYISVILQRMVGIRPVRANVITHQLVAQVSKIRTRRSKNRPVMYLDNL